MNKKIRVTPVILSAFEMLKNEKYGGKVKQMAKGIGIDRGTYYQLTKSSKGMLSSTWAKLEPHLVPYMVKVGEQAKLEELQALELAELRRAKTRKSLYFFVPLKDNMRGKYR